jgi:Flp pilus assembly pilin Flp
MSPHERAGVEMNRLLGRIVRLRRDAEGQDLLEYSLLIALIAAIAASAVNSLGTTVNTVLWQVIAAANI